MEVTLVDAIQDGCLHPTPFRQLLQKSAFSPARPLSLRHDVHPGSIAIWAPADRRGTYGPHWETPAAEADGTRGAVNGCRKPWKVTALKDATSIPFNRKCSFTCASLATRG